MYIPSVLFYPQSMKERRTCHEQKYNLSSRVGRNFRTLKDCWLHALDTKPIQPLAEFNKHLRNYIQTCNKTKHSGTDKTPIGSFLQQKIISCS